MVDIQVGQNGRGVLPADIGEKTDLRLSSPKDKTIIEGAGVRITETYSGDFLKLMGLLAAEHDRLSRTTERSKISAVIDSLEGKNLADNVRFELFKLAVKSLEAAVERYRLTEADLKQMRERKAQMEKKSAEIQKKLRELEAARAKAEKEKDVTKVKDLDRQIDKLKAELAVVKDELLTLNGAIAKTEKDLVALKDEVTKCEAKVTEAANKLSDASRKVLAAALKGLSAAHFRATQTVIDDAEEKAEEKSEILRLPRTIIEAVDRFYTEVVDRQYVRHSQAALEAALREFAERKANYV